MACTDSINDTLNALHATDDADQTTPVITLEYAPYMNWGRWNHNPARVTTLIQHFNDAGLSVQLRHNATETSWEDTVDHGYISVFGPDGAHLVRKDGFQHNRKLRSGGAYDATAMASVVAEVTEALAKAKVEKAVEKAPTSTITIEPLLKEPVAEAEVGASAA